MGNVAYRVKRAPEISHSNSTQHHHGHSDYGTHSHSFTTADAPWNVTKWIDPLDPNPKITSMPIILVIRR